MRNYIRYIVVLVLIIAGGLLIISVVNKFTEPEVSKVNNKPAVEESTTRKDNDDRPTLDVNPGESNNQSQSNNNTLPQENNSTNSSNPSTPETNSSREENFDNIVVPNTGTEENLLSGVLGFLIITSAIFLIRQNTIRQK